MRKKELIAQVASATKRSQKEVEMIVNETIKQIKEALSYNEDVVLTEFLTLKPCFKAANTVKTFGVEKKQLEHYVIKAKFSKTAQEFISDMIISRP